MVSLHKIMVLIPCFNEEGSIVAVIQDLKKHVPEAHVVVISDGSTDKTASIAESEGATVLKLVNNVGIGAAVQTGLIFSSRNDVDLAIQFDGDGQHVASEIHTLIEPIELGHANISIGSRWIEDYGYESSAPRKIGIRVAF